MRIAVGSDHAGFLLKEAIKDYLTRKGYEVIDVGTHSEESVDYPDFGAAAARLVAEGKADFGIVCCYSAEGIAIAANKIKGIRCGIGYNDDIIPLLRKHNDANMVAFGAGFMKTPDVLRRVDRFLEEEFEGGRHLRRVNKIKELEK